jgi:hypothetical protein
MAAWWTLAISVGGTLLGVLIGIWGQGSNSLRLVKLQNVMEEKRRQYLEFLTLIEEWDNMGGGMSSLRRKYPEMREQSGEVRRTVVEAANKGIRLLYTNVLHRFA